MWPRSGRAAGGARGVRHPVAPVSAGRVDDCRTPARAAGLGLRPERGCWRTTTTASTVTRAAPSVRCREWTRTSGWFIWGRSARCSFPPCGSDTSSCRRPLWHGSSTSRDSLDLFSPNPGSDGTGRLYARGPLFPTPPPDARGVPCTARGAAHGPRPPLLATGSTLAQRRRRAPRGCALAGWTPRRGSCPPDGRPRLDGHGSLDLLRGDRSAERIAAGVRRLNRTTPSRGHSISGQVLRAPQRGSSR